MKVGFGDKNSRPAGSLQQITKEIENNFTIVK